MNLTEAPLFRRYPSLRGRLPWLQLGTLPTPVEPLAIPGFGDDLWIKRDDRSGDAYGGNKVRKLEFLLALAESRGSERLITAGALGSHHALATAWYGRERGMRVTLCLCPQPLHEKVAETLLLDHSLGAELVYVPRVELVPAALLTRRIRYLAEHPFIVPPGGSDPVGTLGYVNGALELAEQIEAGEAPLPDVVHVACGTMGTAAGLAVGFALAGIRARVHAVRVVGSLVAGEGRLRRLTRATLRFLGELGVDTPHPAVALELLHMDHDCLGEGYAHLTPAAAEASERLAAAGVTVDPTYTAKAAAGLLTSVRAEPKAVHLFWHTLSGTLPRPPDGRPSEPGDLPLAFRTFCAPSVP